MILTEGQDVFVRLVDLKNNKVSESVTMNEDGTYTIFIDSNLSNDAQLQRYLHALCHIKARDFEKSEGNIQDIESVAHEYCRAILSTSGVAGRR